MEVTQGADLFCKGLALLIHLYDDEVVIEVINEELGRHMDDARLRVSLLEIEFSFL